MALKGDDEALGPGAYTRQMGSSSVRGISNNDNHRSIPFDNVSERFGSERKKERKTVLGEQQGEREHSCSAQGLINAAQRGGFDI